MPYRPTYAVRPDAFARLRSSGRHRAFAGGTLALPYRSCRPLPCNPCLPIAAESLLPVRCVHRTRKQESPSGTAPQVAVRGPPRRRVRGYISAFPPPQMEAPGQEGGSRRATGGGWGSHPPHNQPNRNLRDGLLLRTQLPQLAGRLAGVHPPCEGGLAVVSTVPQVAGR